MKLYHCTLDGIFYALAKNPKANILKTLDANENLEDRVKAFRASYDIWGPELFLKFVRDMDEFLPMINKDGLENIMPYILMKMTTIMGDRDLRTRIRIAEETMEQFPDSKRIVKELTENLNKLFWDALTRQNTRANSQN